MGSTVRSRPSHYDALGVKPTATSDEIAQAFARELRRPLAARDLAQLTVAHEVLRNPTKRRAYDASLAPKPQPKAPAAATPFLHFTWDDPLKRAMIQQLQKPALAADRGPRPEAFARPDAVPPPAPPPQARAYQKPSHDEAEAPARALKPPRPAPAQDEPSRERHAAGDQVLDELEAIPVEHLGAAAGNWKPFALVAAGVFAGSAFLGAWTGLQAGNEVEKQQAGQAVTLALPAAEARPVQAEAPAPVRVQSPRETSAERRRRAALAAKARIDPDPGLPEAAATVEDDRPGEVASAAPAESEAAVAEKPVAEASEVASVQANLPLPNRVIARTIGRIGYACGQVASAAAVEGAAAGVFKVTCTSGDTYRAAPIRGRYHFSRWGRH